MSNKKFMCIIIPVLAVLAAILIAGDVLLNIFSEVITSQFFGYGATTVSGGSELYDYYDNPYEDESNANEAAMKHGEEISEQVADEGIVLLENDGVLPLQENSTVTPFGYRYMWPVYSQFGSTTMYGGSGSMALVELMNSIGPEQSLDKNCVTTLQEALASNFTVNSATVDAMSKATVHRIDAAQNTTACKEVSPQNSQGANTYLYEYESSIYNGISSSGTGTGLVFIGRDAGEGGDLKMDAYADGTPHQLALSVDEKATISKAKELCDKVVVVINSSNLIEMQDLFDSATGECIVDAIVWVGTPGSVGFQSFSDILCGKANPSGKTVSSWLYDNTSDPTYKNIGDLSYNNLKCYDAVGSSTQINVPYVEYEDGIYIDYKYYETAVVEDNTFDFDATVAYPFGYGLSYGDRDGGFTEEITSVSFDTGSENPATLADTADVTIEVTVTNNSAAWAGKDVVELYYTAPYTETDKQMGIEKSALNLLDFAKTGTIQPGGTDKVSFTFNVQDLVSYCTTRDNGDGTTGCYMLDAGDYEISLRSDSHTEVESVTFNVADAVWYDASNPRQTEADGQSELDENGIPTGERGDGQDIVAATNQFDDMTSYMNENATQLSRKDWSGTQPTQAYDKAAPDDVVTANNTYSTGKYDYKTDTYLGNVSGSLVYNDTEPVSNAGNDITFVEMRGVNYNDEKWDELLDNLDYTTSGLNELSSLFFYASYSASVVSAIGFDAVSTMMEGPAGVGTRTSLSSSTLVCAYPSGMLQASTWNTELEYQVGVAIAWEYANIPSKAAVNGWTGPSMNCQRSPFSGRNGEYYSVDPILSGYIGKAVIEGASDSGLYCVFKHLAMYDEETNRQSLCVWANEQAVREQYLKTFELIIKEGRKTVKYYDEETGTVRTKVMKASMSAMTTMTRMGAIPTGGNYALCTAVVRNEWGFEGFLLSDMPSQTDSDLLMRAGGDMQLTSTAFNPSDWASNTMKNIAREAVHHIMFAVVNSNYMQGKGPGVTVTQAMNGYDITVIVFNIIVPVLIVAFAAWLVIRLIDGKRHPGKYGSKKDDAASGQ